jgi:hypothetical protein
MARARRTGESAFKTTNAYNNSTGINNFFKGDLKNGKLEEEKEPDLEEDGIKDTENALLPGEKL